ncbi:MAG: hypothetical protein JOY90_34050 [Bradyrhizobium sp.]|uniref:hypothetical protein n=1 Tax=Bradyrhizobium sp. TaxID=376 RepID=UPI001D85CDBA|nr:hypothetical protein [Bradyrhizobium sp.]MBV9565439.1 hypothetical protein [Bradyrhizobium sp.]
MSEHVMPVSFPRTGLGDARRPPKRSRLHLLARAVRYHMLRLALRLGEFLAAGGPLS